MCKRIINALTDLYFGNKLHVKNVDIFLQESWHWTVQQYCQGWGHHCSVDTADSKWLKISLYSNQEWVCTNVQDWKHRKAIWFFGMYFWFFLPIGAIQWGASDATDGVSSSPNWPLHSVTAWNTQPAPARDTGRTRTVITIDLQTANSWWFICHFYSPDSQSTIMRITLHNCSHIPKMWISRLAALAC